MTRRDYVMLSTALRRAYRSDPQFKGGVMAAAISIAHDIALANSAFDVARFYQDITEGIAV